MIGSESSAATAAPVPSGAASPLELAVREESGATLCAVEGPLDYTWSPEFRARMEHYTTGRGRLVLDLTRTALLDSAGIRALLEAKQRQEEGGGTLALVITPGTQPERVLRLVGLHEYFAPFDSAEAAARVPPTPC